MWTREKRRSTHFHNRASSFLPSLVSAFRPHFVRPALARAICKFLSLRERFWHKSEKPKNLQECFCTLFLKKNAFCTYFHVNTKILALQLTQNEPLATHQKTGHLYDSIALSSDALARVFKRNQLKCNMIGAKSVSPRNRQNLVTYNNMPLAKPENEAMWLTVTTASRFEVELTSSSTRRPSIQLTNP